MSCSSPTTVAASPPSLTLNQMLSAQLFVNFCPQIVRTPLICIEKALLPQVPLPPPRLFIKCENEQFTGSYKYRGVLHQFQKKIDQFSQRTNNGQNPANSPLHLVTMSAGNYGKAFAQRCLETNTRGTIVVPSTCSPQRVEMLQSMGVEVTMRESSALLATVEEYVSQGAEFMHPFDDEDLILAYASAGLELLEDIPWDHAPDVLLIGCGGGGFLSAIATCVRLSQHWPNCRIYGVEPETADTMSRSFAAGYAVSNGNAHSVAVGLAPPFVGSKYCFPLCRANVDGIITVTDREIACATLQLQRLVNESNCAELHCRQVEPSGAAAFAAWMFQRLPPATSPVQTIQNVCVVLSGGNVDPVQLHRVEQLVQENS